jgi:hypothetical protein
VILRQRLAEKVARLGAARRLCAVWSNMGCPLDSPFAKILGSLSMLFRPPCPE